VYNALKNMAFADRILPRPPFLYSRERRRIAQPAETFERQKANQIHRLNIILARARRLRGYAGMPVEDELQNWPILTKQAILGHEHEFAEHTFYPAPHAETGGTTGQPLRVKRTIEGIACEQALVDHLAALVGVHVRTARAAMLKNDNVKISSIEDGRYWFDVGQRKKIYSSSHIDAHSAQAYRRSLLDYAPDILFCYPSSADTLAKYLGNYSGVRIPLVFSSSEVLHADARKRIAAAFQSNIIDFYGHAERLVAAYSINGGGYRFIPYYGYVELVPEGEGLARIIVTSLRPGGQIFVRYDTGDLARVPTQDPEILEQIGLGLIAFDGIVGRDCEYIDLPGGRRMFMPNHIARGVQGANSIQFQFDGESTVDIYIVPGEAFSASTVEQIQDNFHCKFPSHISPRIWTIASPLREPNGKAPVLLRNPEIPEKRSRIGLSPQATTDWQPAVGTDPCAIASVASIDPVKAA